MKTRYLEVTYRRGKPLAAYLYLPRKNGEKSCRTEEVVPGVLVDYGTDGTPIGIEIPTPGQLTLERFNEALAKVGLPALEPVDWSPLKAA